MNETKQKLIDEICKAMGKDANRVHLKTRTVAQLRETRDRWVSISRLTTKEIQRHCNVSFIK